MSLSTPIKISYTPLESNSVGMLLAEESPNAGLPVKTLWFTLPPGTMTERDAHEVPELWILQEGSGILHSGDAEIPLSPRNVVFFPPWVSHRVIATGTHPLTVLSIWWSEVGK
jgi:mannose-6-phosphate isomerase-like protein (cupin superfamily)